MKKIFAILAVAGLLTACNNDAGTEKKSEESSKEGDVSTHPDSSKMMHHPGHTMMPPDSGSTQRRPRE